MSSDQIKRNIRWVSLGLLAFLVFLAFAQWLGADRANQVNLGHVLASPSHRALFGRDELGRDLLVRVFVGGAHTLFPSLLALFLVVLFGCLIGVLSVKFGGIVDRLVQVVITLFQAFPPIIFVIGIVGFLGLGIEQTLLAICLTSWTKYAYLVRSLLLDIKEEPYFRYADMFGNTFWSKIKLYYLPSVFPQVVTTMVYDLNTIVMEIAGMGFIGLGAQMPDAEWGAMINTGRSYLQTAPWIVAFPSLFLILFIGCVMVLGRLLKQYFAIQQEYK